MKNTNNPIYVALIPAYKPDAILIDIVNQLSEKGFCIVLVNDGSGTKYEQLFLECSRYAKVLYHIENFGKGSALKTGLSYIVSHCSDDTVVVTVDADGQHRIDDALAICRIAERKTSSLVLGSRKLKENVPLRSQIGNSVTRFVYRVSTGVKVHDTQTGLRAFHASLIPKLLEIPGERYEYEMNVLLQFARKQIPILEHEIETVYLDDNSSSHFDAVRDSIRIYKEILKFSASSFVSFLVDFAAYSLFLLAGTGFTAANVLARIISASVNFSLNRRLVFKSSETLVKSFVKYALLAVCILIGNTAALNLLVHIFGIHQMSAKIITEIVFFVFSWLLQRLVVFRKRGGGQ